MVFPFGPLLKRYFFAEKSPAADTSEVSVLSVSGSTALHQHGVVWIVPCMGPTCSARIPPKNSKSWGLWTHINAYLHNIITYIYIYIHIEITFSGDGDDSPKPNQRRLRSLWGCYFLKPGSLVRTLQGGIIQSSFLWEFVHKRCMNQTCFGPGNLQVGEM